MGKKKAAGRRKRERGGNGSAPKTTRPEANERRAPSLDSGAATMAGRTLDAQPDRIDIRDWVYQPHLAGLPDQLIHCESAPAILDQGQEGACTGFALAAVVNFQLSQRGLRRRVSPRMLYEMARRYDEWPGEDYEGSSARGAIKGWIAHGVCAEDEWAAEKHGVENFTPDISRSALKTPGGAYYRVQHRQVRDMHAALAQAGILYVTLMVHQGWTQPGRSGSRPGLITRSLSYADRYGNVFTRSFPVITRQGQTIGGHAVAIVGYLDEGFIVQNSWGDDWGIGGFALLPYEDYMLHATDVWVAQLGVPVAMDVWSVQQRTADTTAGLHRALETIPINAIRPFVIDVANNGELSRSGHYWTTRADLRRLFEEEIPGRAENWSKRRLLLYLHGGLNDERNTARRVVAFREVLLENEIYPLHVMWESDAIESIRGMIRDLFTDIDQRAAGAGEWMRRFREGLIEAKDRSLELTAAGPGSLLWREMKENAKLASMHPDGVGGMQLLVKEALAAIRSLDPRRAAEWELHVVAHSAGSIFAAHAMGQLTALGVAFKTLQMLAPAITIRRFKEWILPYIRKRTCPHPTLYVLSDVGERDDEVGPYGKSLLYLISNAFEDRRGTPLLGMERFLRPSTAAEPAWPPGAVDSELHELFNKPVDGLPSLVVAGEECDRPGSLSRSDSHGGFDNDPATLNSVLYRVLGGAPRRAFTLQDLQF